MNLGIKQYENAIETIFRIAAGLSFIVLIGTVLIQVGGRLVSLSPVWTEELTRFALLYLAAFGVGVSLRTGELVNIDIINDYLPGKAPKRLKMFSSLLAIGFVSLLMVPAYQFVSIGELQTSPALGVRMDYIHWSIILLLASLLIFSVLELLRLITEE